MTHKIDLHGVNHNEALVKTEDFVLNASLDKPMMCEIITGNSNKLQQKIITEVLDPHRFSYYIPSNNQGMIIVTDNGL